MDAETPDTTPPDPANPDTEAPDTTNPETGTSGRTPPPDALELIHLADVVQSVSVRLTSTAPAVVNPRGLKYYYAVATVTSGFLSGSTHLGFTSDELADWGRLLDAMDEAVDDPAADPDEPFTADWPLSGGSAHLRFFARRPYAGHPYVVEVRDESGTGIVVSVPLDMDYGWRADARRRLAAVRAALGE
ncbi:DUF5959 family protein [Streptomyces sp. NPDC059698]|uniref:DUF5959 family protein n=1 Tax=unclassified Streptomyces TaxID=2593676 RepID=UPI001F5B9986|nr:DUF5959 family protein [Streptomyces sp. CB02366]